MHASPVRVLLRLRPTAIPYPGVRTDDNTISVDLPKKDTAGPNNSIVNHKFTLDGIQDSATQEDIYNQVAHGHVQDVLQGYSATVIAYGATASGKSFSMVGQKASFAQRGIIPRALANIFHAAATSIDRWINVSVSCMEIYNDQMYDLLSDDPATAAELKCQEDESGKITVKGLTVKATATEEDALKLFFTAEAARATARDKSGSHASRSHFVFGVHLSIRSCTAAGDAAECAHVATLALVDLAGTERAKKAGADGQWMREARSINRSLAFLEQIVNILAHGEGKAHIPYRQNRLTAVLKAALGGNSRSTMLVHVWPEATQLEEAVTTLRFAECMRRLQTAPQKEVAADPEVLLRRCQQQVRDLKQELAMRDTLAGREAASYDELEEAEVQEISSLMRQVLSGELDVDSVPTKTFREIQEAFKQSQVLYQELAATCAEMQAVADAAPAALNAKQAPAKTLPDAKKAAASKGGTPPAPVEAPQESMDPSVGEPGDSGTWGDGDQGHEGEDAVKGTDDGLNGKRTLPKPQAFTFFKHSVAAGRDAAAALKDAGAQQRAKLQQQAEAAVTANQLSGEVAHAKATVRDHEASFPVGEIDEEDPELKVAREKLRAIKDGARGAHEAYARHGAEAEEMLDTVAEARRRLMDAFEAWFEDEGAFLGEDLHPFDPDETYAIMSRQRIMAEDSEKFPFVAAKRASRGAAGRLKEFAGSKAKGMSMRKKEHVAAINFGTVNRY